MGEQIAPDPLAQKIKQNRNPGSASDVATPESGPPAKSLARWVSAKPL
jgi:hypothetical protein